MKRKLALVFVLILLITGCKNNNVSNDDSSTQASDILESEQQYFDNNSLLEIAKQLLEKDKLLTDLFVGGILTELVDVSGKNPANFTSATSSEYEDFYVIEKLLSSTYSVSGGVISKYLGFPEYGYKSILSIEGKTYFSFHFIDDFAGIDINSISLSDGENENVKIITAGEYTLAMIYDGSEWLLEDSIYFLYKQKEDTKETDLIFPLMNNGTAKALSGKILVVEIFISDKDTSFSDEDKAEFEAKISDGINYLKKTAEKYNNTLEIDYKQRSYTHKSEINFIDDHYAFDFALAKTSFKNLDKYINDNYDTSIYDSYFAVLCVDKKGDGYAIPFVKGEADVFYSERFVLFTDDSSGDIAKNILSLFGAETQTDEYLTELYEKYSKNDIMLGTDIQNAEISEFTAYQTGMTKFLDKQFYAFYVTQDEELDTSFIN
ncbi:MAG: hypothetical protein A2Y15_07290 [Clostridiales bacterium GWF2_36_10]|nr:MAG: hypothetical protein A2Y15_07290 [Clostridiales bacterium GWF2_36_10]HAN21310.1 hypothetical protein [Clostridiales bacterium]